ncbi:MAG: hypothetical protein ACTSUL_05990, partial [Promethearchaeota archaeon]
EEKVEINDIFKREFDNFIQELENIFGIFPDIEKQLKGVISEQFTEKDKLINSLIEIINEMRNELRRRKIFDLSDSIREKMRELGITVEDKKLS